MTNFFPTDYNEILSRLRSIDPKAYASDRNFLNGHVTRLSPYISRGVISGKQVFYSLRDRGYSWLECEKLVQEICWREYFQRIWQILGEKINDDIKNVQRQTDHDQLPSAMDDARTGIEAVDEGIQTLYETGYMHNHLRMYVASIACNVGKSKWLTPAKWMYYHLLDADWASNACSWQWVCGTFSQKKYFANQENINKYCNTFQRSTFLDVGYDQFDDMTCPDKLKSLTKPELVCQLPAGDGSVSLNEKKVLIYNWYNLDPTWHAGEAAGRVLLLEPSIFAKYPISGKSMNFMLALTKNIEGIRVFTGEFSELKTLQPNATFVYKEHPLNAYSGIEEKRDFLSEYMFSGTPGFFNYWKKIETQLSHAWS